jgi:hypothetical protein
MYFLKSLKILKVKQWSKGAHVARNNMVGPWLDLASYLCLTLMGLVMVSVVQGHHDIMTKDSKPCLNSIL